MQLKKEQEMKDDDEGKGGLDDDWYSSDEEKESKLWLVFSLVPTSRLLKYEAVGEQPTQSKTWRIKNRSSMPTVY